jgi:hypothetical protein
MPKMDEMPDSYARKFHEDRRQHGEVAAVTIVNSDAFKDGWDRVFGVKPEPKPVTLKAFADMEDKP